MKEPVMSMYATKQECLEARADFFENQRDILLTFVKDFVTRWESYGSEDDYSARLAITLLKDLGEL